jgi:predicted DNA binding CopG/RHH family protein
MEEEKMKAKPKPSPQGEGSVLDTFEQSIEDTAENFIPVTETEKAEIEAIIASANKTRNINIRISAYDMEKVKQKSAAEGLPYQTLISSIIHKYITGKLVDEQAVLKSIQLLTGC